MTFDAESKYDFDAESKYGVDAVLTLKVNAQKCGVNFFRKSMRYVENIIFDSENDENDESNENIL